MRLAWAGLALLASGCIIEVDYGGTRFSCAVTPVCPSGFECVSEICVPEESGSDAGPDAAIDAGAGAAEER